MERFDVWSIPTLWIEEWYSTHYWRLVLVMGKFELWCIPNLGIEVWSIPPLGRFGVFIGRL